MCSPHPGDCPHCRAHHEHRVGTALLHLGKHPHGARAITEGERTNLILWCRAKRLT